MARESFIGAEFLRVIFDAIPVPVFVVDSDVQVQLLNRAAAAAFDLSMEESERRGGDILGCIGATEAGCGRGPDCRDCIIRSAVSEAAGGATVLRRRTVMGLVRGDEVSEANLLITAAPFSHDGNHFVLLTMEDIGELLQLRSLLPICANCKKIRNEKDYWESVERYFKTSLDLDFTHSICPDCLVKLYPELADHPMLKGEEPDDSGR